MILLLLCCLAAEPIVIDGVDVTGWTTRQLWDKADEYFHAGEYRQAVRLQDRIIEIDPADLEAYSVAAWLIWSLGDEPEAREYLRRSIRNNPDAAAPYAELGFHYLDRLGRAEEAIPYLEQAIARPPFDPQVERTLAHAYLFAERPWDAVRMWDAVAARGETAPAVVANNRLQALANALRPDMQLRGGGVTDTSPDPAAVPTVVSDERADWDDDGFAEHRVLTLAPATGDERYRLHYLGEPVIYKTRWHWQATTVLDERGVPRAMLVDTDGDGFAELIPPLTELRGARTEWTPDRFELGRDETGRAVPLSLTVEGGDLVLAPPLLIATEREGLALRLELREAETLAPAAGAWQPLPTGVYCAGDAPSPARVTLPTADLPEGRYLPAAVLTLGEVGVDHKLIDQVVIKDSTGVRLAPATSEELGRWHRPAPRPPAPDMGSPENEGR